MGFCRVWHASPAILIDAKRHHQLFAWQNRTSSHLLRLETPDSITSRMIHFQSPPRPAAVRRDRTFVDVADEKRKCRTHPLPHAPSRQHKARSRDVFVFRTAFRNIQRRLLDVAFKLIASAPRSRAPREKKMFGDLLRGRYVKLFSSQVNVQTIFLSVDKEQEDNSGRLIG